MPMANDKGKKSSAEDRADLEGSKGSDETFSDDNEVWINEIDLVLLYNTIQYSTVQYSTLLDCLN